ncbi:MAG: DUF1232 domain-containing protein [Hyphomicrobium sp.]|jgi:uncharacterized membrane protein YkvA (DUF1232 family)
MAGVFRRLEGLERVAKRDGIALYLAARDPRVPLAVKVLAVLVAAYVLSPIDLIPDFIPVLGYLDEVVLVPVAVAVILRFLDPALVEEHRMAATLMAERPVSWLGAALVVLVWAVVTFMVLWFLWPRPPGA